MKNLFNLLERFNRSLNKDALTKQTVVSVIGRQVGLSVPQENVSLKDGVLELNAGASLKMAIKLKEEGILSELKGAGLAVTRILYK